MLDQANSYALSADELRRLDVDGFVVRERVFDAAECAAIAQDCEDLISRLEQAGRRTKHVVGSYMFEIQRDAATVVKWEPDAPEVVQGVEPFAHISPALKAWGLDPRLVDPCKAIVGGDELMLFTEKLNVKRARHGGPIVLHQDFPYWENLTPVARSIATAMVFLDDATIANGCLEVAPGTHKAGKWPQRTDADGFAAWRWTSGPSTLAGCSRWRSRPGRWRSSAPSWCTARCPTAPMATAAPCSTPTSPRASPAAWS